MVKLLVISGLAGVVGTGLGGIVGLIFGKSGDTAVGYLLSFAAGVMLSVAFFDLIPESVSLSDSYITIASIILGVICICLLNMLVDYLASLKRAGKGRKEMPGRRADRVDKGKYRMLRSGVLMFLAIALHNLPEGMAIGSGGVHDEPMGVALAVLIGLHDIPEGISIAVPLIEGGMNRGGAVLLTALSGLPTLFGGLLGVMIGGAGDIYVSVSLGVAAGAMLYVTMREMLPQAVQLGKPGRTGTVMVIGTLFGLLMVQLLS